MRKFIPWWEETWWDRIVHGLLILVFLFSLAVISTILAGCDPIQNRAVIQAAVDGAKARGETGFWEICQGWNLALDAAVFDCAPTITTTCYISADGSMVTCF